MILTINNFLNVLEQVVDNCAADLAEQAIKAGLTSYIDLYDHILELKGGPTVERNLESLGFELIKLCEEAQLMMEK